MKKPLQWHHRLITVALIIILLTGTTLPIIPINSVYSTSIQNTQTTVDVLVSKDSFLTQGSQSNNEGANPILRIISSDKNRPLVSFDQNTINDNLKFGRTLQSATLRLYITENGNNWSDGRTIEAHRLLDDWVEGNGWNVNNSISGTGSGTTWGCAIDSDISNNQNNCAIQWNGGMSASLPTGTVLMTNNMVNQWIEFDVTSDVQGFLDESMSNYGWMIKKNNEALNGEVQFSSKEFTNTPELRLVVNLSQQEILANQYSAIVDDLGNISQVSDESVVADYLTDAIQILKTDTQNIVTDINTKQQLVSILDSAINSASESGNRVLALDETGANMKISEAKSFVDSYVTQVYSNSGSTISTLDANLLVSNANKIITDSTKTGSDMVTIIIGTPLIVTDQLINRVQTDMTNIRNTVITLNSLGFTVILDAERHSPTQSIVSFFNESTLENFEFQISDYTFSMFTIVAFSEEALNSGKILTNEEFASMMIVSSVISENMNSIQNDVDSVTFSLLAVCSSHFTFNECDTTFSNLVGPLASFKIGSAANGILGSITSIGISVTTTCIQHWDECEFVLDELSKFAFDTGVTTFLQLSPKIIVVTNVINDNGGSLNPSDFTIDVQGLFPNPSHFTGVADSGVIVGLGAGDYNVTEVSVSGYSQSYSPECAGTIDIGQVKTCTITNNDIPPPVVFFEDFNGTAGWTGPLPCVLNHPPGQTCTIGVTSDITPIPSPPTWGYVSTLDFTPGCQNLGTDVEAKYSHPITIPANGTYTLSSWIGTSDCTTCSISSQILIDNVIQLSKVGGTGSPSPEPISFEHTPINMIQGQHTISMRSFTPGGMCFGDFRAFFDDITIVSGDVFPIASSSSVIGGPYFYSEINQTSINATNSSTVIIPLEVEWLDGFSANDVAISFIGNTTDIGVTPSAVSTSNSTTLKLFDLILDISNSTNSGNYIVGVVVTEIDSEDSQIKTIFLNVE